MTSDSVDIVKIAEKAYAENKLELAIDLYSEAIHSNPTSPQIFADRSQAYLKLSNFIDAADDANKAIELDPSMVKAYLCKGTACLKLEEYQTAKAAFEAGAALAPGNFRFKTLIKECDKHIEDENDRLSNLLAEQLTNESSFYGGLHSYSNIGQTTTTSPVNNNHYMTDYFTGDPVEYASSSYQAVEKPNQSTMYSQGPNSYSQTTAPRSVNRHHFIKDRDSRIAAAIQRPSYPSSKHKIDWDKLVATLEEEDNYEKLNEDAPLNASCKDVYGDCDEDTQRPIQNSFVESNGAGVSTNWLEVGTKKVEGTPPDSMEMN